MNNVPLFQEKKEVRAAFSLSSGNYINGFEGQVAYSVTDHIGIMANYFRAAESDPFDFSDSESNGSMIELGAGYFKPIGDYSVFEAYGGIGYGNVHNVYLYRSDVTFSRVFVQPSIGITMSGFDVAISTRFCGLTYHDLQHNAGLIDDSQSLRTVRDLSNMEDQRFYVLFEPAITIRGGWKYVKIQTQVGYSENLSNKELKQENLNISMGLYISFANKFHNTGISIQ